MGFLDFFKSLDYFGVQINFNFKNEKKYTSFSGGLIFVIYVILCVSYVTINFIYFLQKKHKTVIYYDKELFTTDEIYFHKHNSTFAVNMVCDNYDGKFDTDKDIYSKFKIQGNHVKYIKIDGKSQKTKTSLKFHKCTYEDFFNQFNDELDRNDVTNKHYCFNDDNYVVKGIFSDEDFEYFEFTFSATCENGFDNRTYLEIFYRYDCKFSLYYVDSAIDVANVTYPMRAFLNQKFIQITPSNYKKVNLFYTIKSFKSDENWLFNWPKNYNYLAFSNAEEYAVDKGEKRFLTKYDDYDKFAKFFIRASSTRNMIERRYEKFTEFVASSTSILSAIFIFLESILNVINESLALKEIIDNLCFDQKKNLEKKILLKANINNCQNINLIKNQKKFNILKNDENINNYEKEKTHTDKDSPKSPSKKNILIQGESNGKETDNIYCDTTQSKMNPFHLLNILNDNKKSVKMNNFLENEAENEEVKSIPNNSGVNKVNYCSSESNNYQNSNLSGIFNKIINKKENKVAMDSVGQNFELNDEQKKNELMIENKFNAIMKYNLNENNDGNIRDKFNFLNNNIQSSILSYKFCRYFTNCKKNSKNNNLILENSLNYLIKSLDIFTYLKIIKNQDMLINILFDSDDYNLIKRLESLNLYNNNIFDNDDDLYKMNKGKKKQNNINDLEIFLSKFIRLTNKTNKTQMEQRLIELIIKKINDI